MTEKFAMKILGKTRILEAEEGEYACGQKAISLITHEDGYPEPWGTLTVAIPQVTIRPGEIIVKNWSENEEWADAVARKLGYIKTTRYVRTGFVEAFIWEKV